MKTLPLVNTIEMVHLVLIALWLGVVSTETVVELASYFKKIKSGPISVFHYYIDLILEIPFFTGVLITGTIMALQVDLTAAHYALIACGLLAISDNALCAGLVIKRKRLYDQGAGEEVLRRNTRRIITTIVGIVPFIIAAYIGFTLGHQRILGLIN